MVLKDSLYKVCSPLFLPGLISLGLLILLLLRSILRAVLSSLRALPGPFLARFSRLWYLHWVWHGNFQKINLELHKRYGGIVRIAPNEYSIDDPEALKTIYGQGTNFTKSTWYFASGNPTTHTTPDLFTDRDPKRHAANRRKTASLYSMTTLLRMEPCVVECTALIVERFREFALSGASFNMHYWLQCYAFDLIGLITVSKRFGFLDSGSDPEGLFPSLHSYLTYSANVGIYPEVHPILFRFLMYFGGGGMLHLASFTSTQIQERLEKNRIGTAVEKKPGSGDDFLARVLKMHEEDPEKFTAMDVFLTCLSNVVAGSDTTSITLSAILWYLLKVPETLDKLQNEIDGMATKGQISDPVTFQEAQKMPYLQAVIKEALRMHPATGLPMGRVVPEGGAVISGTYFPKGTVVGINSWVAHNNTTVFGGDAGVFRPERWLESEERSQKMERYYIPFGHGSRTCIGKNISLMEISKLIPQLVRMFDLELVSPEAELEIENIWFVKPKNFFCRVSTRKY